MAQPPFNLDIYEYHRGGYYDIFKRDMDKICAVAVSEMVASCLRNEGLVYATESSIPVADIGCGPADTILMHLNAARHKAGFTLYAIDYNQDYTGENGIAYHNLLAIKNSRKLKINDFFVTNGDAFDGNLNTTLKTPPNYFLLVFVSHLLYHATLQIAEKMLFDISHHLLTMNGVGALFHFENRVGSFQYLRSKYGHAAQRTSDVPAMGMNNPPDGVELACKKAGIPCYTARYNNSCYFAPMEEKYWEIFYYPDQYHLIRDRAAIDNLRKLYFIPQRNANAFVADTGVTGLVAFMQEMRNIIAPEQLRFEKEGGFLALAETVQLIGNLHASPQTQEKLSRAASYLQARLLELEKQSFRT